MTLPQLKLDLTGLPGPAAPGVIGVSGGRDSVALLHALVAEHGYQQLTVAHLDHALRAESAEEGRFVAALAASYGLPAVVERVEVAARANGMGQSLEVAARQARYAFFARVRREVGAECVFVAHHADDQAETFLWNLLRGSGRAGLAGMERLAQRYDEETNAVWTLARPMLGVWRAEVEGYVAAHRLPFVEDASNESRAHTRNRLRREVIPFLEQVLERPVRGALWRAAEILAAENEVLAADPALQELPEQLPVASLRALPLALQRRKIQAWLRHCGVPQVGYGEVEQVRGLLTNITPAKVNLPGGHHARRRAGVLFVELAG